MGNNFEFSERSLQSEETNVSSESVGQIQAHKDIEYFNYKGYQNKDQKNTHDKVSVFEATQADTELEKELEKIEDKIIHKGNLDDFLKLHFRENAKARTFASSFINQNKSFSLETTSEELLQYISSQLNEKESISKVDQVKSYKKELQNEGKSQIQILQILISAYEVDESLASLVANFKNFLKLHQFANKLNPQEKTTINHIISAVDITESNSFSLALLRIEESSRITTETKLDIKREFSTTGINSVTGFDQTLNKEKNFKRNIEKQIDSKIKQIDILTGDISKLQQEIEKLPLDDPKRSQLEEQLKEKEGVLKSTENDLSTLNSVKPEEVKFMLRKGLVGVLNPDGSRSVRILSENFTIQLPSNRLPFQETKSLRAINTAFPFLVLRSLNIAQFVFVPELKDNSIPSKSQRDISHLIMSSLGIVDSKIINDSEIAQLQNDLSKLEDAEAGKSGQECLIALEIFDLSSQTVNKSRLKSILQFIRKNRKQDLQFEDILSHINEK
ncbi:MAG: hypothetical protein R2764_08260 [Bacteroidales bacterium]